MTFHDDDSSGDGVHEDEADTEVKCVKSKDDYFDNASTQAISSLFLPSIRIPQSVLQLCSVMSMDRKSRVFLQKKFKFFMKNISKFSVWLTFSYYKF